MIRLSLVLNENPGFERVEEGSRDHTIVTLFMVHLFEMKVV